MPLLVNSLMRSSMLVGNTDGTCDVEFYDGIYNHLIACGATDMNQLK